MLDHIIAHSITGRYLPMPDLPVIEHPVILGDGLHCWCLSTSPAADGTRAGDYYLVNCQGATPVCSCPGFTYHRDCPHVAIVAAQLDALCKARTARWAAEKAAREGRAA